MGLGGMFSIGKTRARELSDDDCSGEFDICPDITLKVVSKMEEVCRSLVYFGCTTIE